MKEQEEEVKTRRRLPEETLRQREREQNLAESNAPTKVAYWIGNSEYCKEIRPPQAPMGEFNQRETEQWREREREKMQIRVSRERERDCETEKEKKRKKIRLK